MTSAQMEAKTTPPVVGAWYQGRDFHEIKKVFGIRAARYLQTPRRAVKTQKSPGAQTNVVFSTLGDRDSAIGCNGAVTKTPIWNIWNSHWLQKVKDPDNLEGKEYRVNANWKHEANRRHGFQDNHMAKWLRPDFAGQTVKASHESFSGVSIWVRNQEDELACISKSYLDSVEPVPERIAQEMDKYTKATDKAVKKCDNVLKKVDKIHKIIDEETTKILSKLTHNSAYEKAGGWGEKVRNEEVIQDLQQIGVFPEPVAKGETAAKPIKDCESKPQMDKKEYSMSNDKVKTIDEKVRLMESRVRELEAQRIEEYDEEEDFDPSNDLDHSMVLDLPPAIAEWAREAGIGIEDMLPLAEKICQLQSNMEQTVQGYIHGADTAQEKAAQVTRQVTSRNWMKTSISNYRHQTLRTLIKWGATAGTFIYLAQQFV